MGICLQVFCPISAVLGPPAPPLLTLCSRVMFISIPQTHPHRVWGDKCCCWGGWTPLSLTLYRNLAQLARALSQVFSTQPSAGRPEARLI